MKKAFSALLAGTMVLSLVACGSSSSSSSAVQGTSTSVAGSNVDTGADAAFTEVRIGALAPLTGSASQYGEAVNNGVKLAVEEINAAGGILGAQIVYTVEDDKGDPTEAINAYNKLMDQGIDVLLGAVTSAPSVAVAQEAVMDGIPMISASATQEDFTLVGDNIFRTCFIDPYQGELMANYAKDVHGVQTVAVLYDTSNDYSEGIAAAFQAEAESLGMEVVAYEGYPGGTVDFNSQLTKIMATNPDAIMAPCYYEEAAMIIVQARKLGIESIFLGPDGWDGVLNQVDETNYEYLNNSYFCNQYSRESTDPSMQNFLTTYNETYGIVENMFAVLGYDSVYILKAAIEDAGTLDYAAVTAAMQNVSVKGLTGTTTFDANGNPVRSAVITEFKDGAAVVADVYDINGTDTATPAASGTEEVSSVAEEDSSVESTSAAA